MKPTTSLGETTVDPMEEREAVRVVFEEAWNRQSFAPLQPVFADQFEFHVGGSSRMMRLDELREIVAKWHAGFPDLRFEVNAIVACDGWAAARANLKGTHRGVWSGLEATGRPISVEHMFFFRFGDGRIVEVWELLDRSELRRQLVS